VAEVSTALGRRSRRHEANDIVLLGSLSFALLRVFGPAKPQPSRRLATGERGSHVPFLNPASFSFGRDVPCSCAFA